VQELVRSNDPVYLSWAQAMLRGEGIESLLVDLHISGVEGNIGAFPRRLLVADDDLQAARQVLEEAGAAGQSGLDGHD
jgi:Putative prokaryotic signal transducing protein